MSETLKEKGLNGKRERQRGKERLIFKEWVDGNTDVLIQMSTGDFSNQGA